MTIPARCRPSLAKAAISFPVLLIGLALGGCGYTPDRSLTASSAAVPDNSQPAKASQAAKASRSVAKAQGRNATENVKVFSRSTSSAQSPRRRIAVSMNERECLVRAMYFESQRASRDGLLAVGTVVMNRVNSPSFPGTICGVVGQKYQFASGVLSRPMTQRDRAHADAVADQLLAGRRHDGIGDAMFFHVATRRYKYQNMRYLQVAGGNIFYTKVGRNAPRVVAGSALAYANTPPDVAKVEAAQVEIARVEAVKVDVVKPQTTTVAAIETAVSREPADASAAITAAVPAPVSIPLPVPAERLSFTAPVDEALLRARSFSAAPLKLAQYRLPK